MTKNCYATNDCKKTPPHNITNVFERNNPKQHYNIYAAGVQSMTSASVLEDSLFMHYECAVAVPVAEVKFSFIIFFAVSCAYIRQ